MGLSLQSYVGPVIIAKKQLATRNESYRCCTNEKCLHKKEQKSPFCNQCGSKIGTKDKAIKEWYPTSSNVMTALTDAGLREDRLWRNSFCNHSEEIVLYTANEKICDRDFDQEEARSFTLSYKEFDIASEIEAFKKFYAKEIEILNALYVSLEFDWMVINHES